MTFTLTHTPGLQVSAALTFDWHWEKLGMTGTGSGELLLAGGNIDYRFRVVASSGAGDSAGDASGGPPQIVVDEDGSRFDSVELRIKSFSADWL